MRELYKVQAESVRDGYVSMYEDIKTEIDKNMGDMDFTNSKQKTEMQEKIASMKTVCDSYISILNEMTFE